MSNTNTIIEEKQFEESLEDLLSDFRQILFEEGFSGDAEDMAMWLKSRIKELISYE